MAHSKEYLTTDGSAQNGLTSRRAIAFIAGLTSLAALWIARHHRVYADNFWDAQVYADAIRQWRSGIDPYQLGHVGVPFLYPPLFILVASSIETVLGASIGWYLYIGLTLAAVLAIPLLMCGFYSKRAWLTYPIASALFFAGPRLVGASTAIDGNVSSLCAVAILLAGIQGVRQDKWATFYVAVIAASCIKPTFLSLLLLPLFTAGAQAIRIVFAGAITGSIYMLQRAALPTLFENFRQNVVWHTIEGHNDGYSVFGLARHLSIQMHEGDGVALPTALHLAFCGFAIGTLTIASRRFRPGATDSTWLSLVLITAITSNPRMMDYEAAIAIVPALAILVSGLRSSSLRPWTATMLIFCLIGSLGPTGTGTLMLLLSGLIIGYLNLASSPREAASLANSPRTVE